MKKGFTLVELSIVLVIIGLLIGGILAAQSMIKTSRIEAFVKQMQQFDIAAVQFKQKFNAIAGDSSLAYIPTHQGACYAQDGKITDDDCGNNDAVSSREIGIFWFDLVQLSGLVVENCSRLAVASPLSPAVYPAVAGSNCTTPEAKLGKNLYVMAAADNPGSTTDMNNSYYIIDMSAYSGGGYMTGPVAAISQVDALAYDSKVDDGLPNSGKILGGSFSGDIQLAHSVYTYGTSYDSSSATKLVLVQEMGTNDY